MKTPSEDQEVAEEAPVVKPKITVVVILAVLLGILATVIAVGAFVHYKNSRDLEAEVLAVKDALKEKSLALDGMKEQIEILSRQMHALREYSIARSSSPIEKSKKAGSATPVAVPVENSAKPAIAKEKNGSSALATPPQKPKADPQNCELVGKSPEEQASTLQRCVNMIDPPKGGNRR